MAKKGFFLFALGVAAGAGLAYLYKAGYLSSGCSCETESVPKRIIHECSGKDGVTAVDTDGDGVADTVCMDTDGDGITDTAIIDADGDGQPETVLLDTDGDGVFDTAVREDGPET